MNAEDKKLLNDNDWEVECESPFNLSHKITGDKAEGQAAYDILYSLTQNDIFKDLSEDKEIMILVPKDWFDSLLKYAQRFKETDENYQYGNPINDKVHLDAVMLCGYATSAATIIKYNERIIKLNK